MIREEIEAIINDERSTEITKVVAESLLKDLRIEELEDELQVANRCAEEARERIKELESIQHTDNTEVIANAEKRIKELEYKLRDKGGKNAELQATNSALRKRIKELEASQPKPPKSED